jgi:arylsulfatase A-like enzyme
MQRVTGRVSPAEEAELFATVRRAHRLYFDARRRPLTSSEVSELTTVYDASVMALDAQVQTLFTALTRRQLLDDAIVLITADHGEDLLEHGGVRRPGTLWETRLHVPLLLLVPGKTTRTDVTEPVSLVDVAPTLLALLGLPVPPGFEGRVLLPVMQRAEFPRSVDSLRWRLARWWRGPQEPVYAEAPIRRGATRPRHRRALVLGSHKLVVADNGMRAYFDLQADPNEANPRALGAADRKRLDAALDGLQERFMGGAPVTSTRTLTPADLAQLRALGDLDE